MSYVPYGANKIKIYMKWGCQNFSIAKHTNKKKIKKDT